jgi:lactate dehydrogenase-like 2-hydroxyacid dehydrogenase
MITAGDTRLTQRIGETVTRLAGMGMDVEYHDNDNDDDYV